VQPELQLHCFLTLTLDEDDWVESLPTCSTSREQLRYPLNRSSGGPQSWSGRLEAKKNLLPQPAVEPRFVSCVELSLVTVLTALSAATKFCYIDARKL